MRIVALRAENFKGLKVVEIAPNGNVVTIGGKNGAGKSSVLDAIWVALVGKSVAPPKPIRKGEEEARIQLSLGDLIITRRFTDKDGKITDSIKVADPQGRTYPSPQKVLDELLGNIGFDPFAFVQMKAEKQAETLMSMVPLEVDIDEDAEADENDFAERREVNRRIKETRAQIDAIDVPLNPPAQVDRDALIERLTNAANTNGEIERERVDRADTARVAQARREHGQSLSAHATELRAQAELLDKSAASDFTDALRLEKELSELPPIADPVDTEALRDKIRAADVAAQIHQKIAVKQHLTKVHDEDVITADKLTKAMDDREAARNAALAKAKMPIAGLGFAIDGKKISVMFNGVPFEQASMAEKLKASTAIAMAANPQLRVLRIMDGSLLDEDSIKLLSDMAQREDFQLFVEVVSRDQDVGIIIENGEVVGGSMAENKPKEKPKAQPKGKEKPEGALL